MATELCYNTDEHSHSGPNENEIWHYCDARGFSKCLSNYMIYLLYQQSSLMSEVSGIAKQRFRDTLAEAQRFFSQGGRGQLAEDCKKILKVDTSIKPAHVKGNISESALFDASTLAKELKILGTQKWEVMS